MKKSFLIFGVMGVLCATNGWAQDEASDTLSRATKVTQRIEKVETNNVNALSDDPEVKELEEIILKSKKKPGRVGLASCPRGCALVWDEDMKAHCEPEAQCGRPRPHIGKISGGTGSTEAPGTTGEK